jgi:homoserine dehydrogenase
MKVLRVGIVGFGTVGTGVCKCLLQNGAQISEHTGVELLLQRIADLDIVRDRGVMLPAGILTTDAAQVTDAADIDVVVELIGGCGVARDVILRSLRNGKSVVTANKALISKHGEELFQVAEEHGVDLYYEASVGGGIPIIKALREGLAANRISRVFGILNGTCNYILTRMEREHAEFDQILKEAQASGYAEADPGLDIDGIDTAHKAAILASLAFGCWYGLDKVHIEGIRNVTLADIESAKAQGYRIKLLAVIKQTDKYIELRVQPSLVPIDSLLGNVNEVFNAVWVEGDFVGPTMFYGRGAGRDATASAVVADLVDIGRNLKFDSSSRVPGFRPHTAIKPVRPMEQIQSRYYVRIAATDRLGLLANVTRVFSDCHVSISGLSANDPSRIIVLTHMTSEAAVRDACQRLRDMPEVAANPFILRIIDLH